MQSLPEFFSGLRFADKVKPVLPAFRLEFLD
jgi:hypothetical protein